METHSINSFGYKWVQMGNRIRSRVINCRTESIVQNVSLPQLQGTPAIGKLTLQAVSMTYGTNVTMMHILSIATSTFVILRKGIVHVQLTLIVQGSAVILMYIPDQYPMVQLSYREYYSDRIDSQVYNCHTERTVSAESIALGTTALQGVSHRSYQQLRVQTVPLALVTIFIHCIDCINIIGLNYYTDKRYHTNTGYPTLSTIRSYIRFCDWLNLLLTLIHSNMNMLK